MIVCRHRKSSRYKLDLVNNCPGNPNPDLALDSTMRSRGLVERKVTGFGDEQVMDLAKLDDIAMRRTNRVAGAGAIAKPLRRRYRLAHATDATDRAGASELSPGLMPSRLFSEIPLVLRSGSWFGISTGELKARHLHSLIAIFCPRQHHFRPITLVAPSDDSFGIALAVLFVRSRPVSGYQIFCAREL